MTLQPPASATVAAPWTCPFCPLLCDTFSVTADPSDGRLSLVGSDCHRAQAALAHFEPSAPIASALRDGQACSTEDAVATAAQWLRDSRQPLFGGLATDVAGARALYPLACATGAIADHAHGAALMHGIRAQQDRGGFTTTLAEVHARADLVVCIGGVPTVHYPEFFNRIGTSGEDLATPREIVILGGEDTDAGQGAAALPPGTERVALQGDLFASLALLAAAVAGRSVNLSDAPTLGDLAARLNAARYAVLVYETARLPAQGALLIETVQRIVATLNQRTRAAALPLGGADGASTVNGVFTWLSGMPLRSRATPIGLLHDPSAFTTERLLADQAVDCLLWISSFGPGLVPPAVDMPRIVLGHPGMAASPALQGARTVFIPVATPGIDTSGHLFRTDSSVLMPLHAARAATGPSLPGVAQVIGALTKALQAMPAAASLTAEEGQP